MRKPGSYLKSDGLTLIELLSAITLLSIVIIIFLNIFSESIFMSRKVEDKLSSVNVAEKVLNTVRRGDPSISYEKYPYKLPKVNGKTYYPVVTVTQTTKESELGLKLVHVKIYSKEDFDKESKPDSQIFGYIEIGGE